MSNIKKIFCNFKINRITKFSLSSMICFIIDYSLFALLSCISSNIIMSNLLARIISGTCNYLINRKYVFKSNIGVYKSFLSYFTLAFMIISLNTFLLHILVDKILINKFIAKVMVEIILFIVNYFIQKKYIFRKR